MKVVHILAIIITIVLVLLVAVKLSTSSADYNKWNPYWNGMSKFYEGRDINFLFHLSDLPSDEMNTTLLIISPTYSYVQNDSAAIEAYLERGGHVIVIDDFGESNSLLKSIETSIQIMPVSLCQNTDYYSSPSLPILTNVSGTGLTAGISQIYTNHPASLTIGNTTYVLASTSRMGWLDMDDNGYFDYNNGIFSSYPVIASENIGMGSLTVISDPDIFINSMILHGDNSKIASGIFNGNAIYVDISHGSSIPPLISAINTIRNNLTAQILSIIIILLASLLGYFLVRLSYHVDLVETIDNKYGERVIIDSSESSQLDHQDDKRER